MKTLLVFAAALVLANAQAAPVLVGAAADLASCMDDLAAAFRAQAPGAQLKVSIAASGTLYAQIRNGAPFDVFMSADMEYPRRLAAEGAAEGASLYRYADGRLAVWAADPAADLAGGLPALAQPRFARIAIANPDVAPYGRAAKAALVAAGVWDQVQARLVVGENIAQTAQFVQTGNAQVGLVSGAALLTPRLKGTGVSFVVPGVAIEQGAVLTLRGRANPDARRWMQFLRSPAARAVFARYGFGPGA